MDSGGGDDDCERYACEVLGMVLIVMRDLNSRLELWKAGCGKSIAEDIRAT